MLEEWATENTVLFVGHRLQDPDLQWFLKTLTERLPSRPRFYLARPGVDEIERDYWATKQVTVIDTTFETLLRTADEAIDRRFRPLATRLPSGHPVERRFVQRKRPSTRLLEFLSHEAEYVYDGISYESGDARRFFRGFGLGWYPILAGLDVRRSIVERFLYEVVLLPEEDRSTCTELYVIKAEAGAGKSVLLFRLAWEAATQAEVLCLRVRSAPLGDLNALVELGQATDERMFLFLDNAAENVHEIERALMFARRRELKLTVVTAERTNEWNVACEQLEGFVSGEQRLTYLSEKEIGALVDLLEENDAVGPNLRNKTREERISEFVKRSGRQLLVALHEATRGIPFQEILLDEYESLTPPEAQRLYLSVCVLNRFGVPVRAGVISRVHDIPFEHFRKRLFAPLEHVVISSRLPWGDYAYQARHSEIAQIVFDRVLTTAADRSNECIRLIRALNPLFTVDLEALRGLTRAKLVRDLFPDPSDANAIYSAASDTLGTDAYLLQQRANYERLSGGDLRLAETLLNQARTLAPDDTSIVHTLAEVLRARAESAKHVTERTRLRRSGRAVLRRILNESKYAAVTNLKFMLDELRDLLKTIDSGDRAIDETIRLIDSTFQTTKQSFPADNYILAVEADFAKLLNDDERVLDVMRSARLANVRDPYIASRLASLLISRGDVNEARSCLEEAIEGNPNDQRLNYQLAEFLRVTRSGDMDSIVYHYRRAFTKSDRNYESQFWFARFAFESADGVLAQESREVFANLRDISMSYDERIRIRDVVGGFDAPTQFRGTVSRLEEAHGFLAPDGRNARVFFHRSAADLHTWESLRSGARVTFSIGFNMRGPLAIDLRP